MNQETQIDLLHRALEVVESKKNSMVDAQMRQPVSEYISADHYAREQRLFRDHPMIIADSWELREPGSFLTHDHTGVPIIALRTREGELRAFVNACRHRGARLVGEASGRGCKAFVCPYHAWTYNTDGGLIHVPDAYGFDDMSHEALVSLPIREALGFIWVLPNPALEMPESFFAPLAEFSSFSLESHASVYPYTKEIQTNWKIALELGLEAYHVKKTHAHSIYKRVFFSNCSVVDWLYPHIRIVFPSVDIKGAREQDESDWRLRDMAYIGYFLFPNTSILIQPDHAMRMTVFPDGVGKCIAKISTLFPSYPSSEREWRYAKSNRDLMENTLDEDFDMGEAIFKGLQGPGLSELTLGRFEQGLQFFQRALSDALSPEGLREGPASL